MHGIHFGNSKINNGKCIVVIICVEEKRKADDPGKAQSGRHHIMLISLLLITRMGNPVRPNNYDATKSIYK